MANALDDALGATQQTAAPVAAAPAASGGNPLDAAMGADAHTVRSPYATGAFANPAHKPMLDMNALDKEIEAQNAAAGKVASKVFGAFQVPGAAVEHALGGHQHIMDALNHTNVGVIPTSLEDVQHFGEKFGKQTNIGPAGEVAEQTLTDPLAFAGLSVGGRSGIARLGEQAEKHVFPAVVKAGGAGNPVTKGVAAVHDFMGVHSAAKRELARLHGKDWLDKYAEYRAKFMNQDPHFASELDAEIPVHQAEAPTPVPAPRIAPKPKITAKDMASSVMVGGRRMFPDPRTGELLPMPLGAEPLGPATMGRKSSALGRPASAEARAPFKYTNPPLEKPPAGPAVTAEEQRIFDLMGHQPHSAQLPGPVNAIQDLYTAGLFSVPFGHQANITALGAMAAPGATGRAIARGVGDTVKQVMGKGETEESIAARHAGAQAGGALGTHRTETDNALTQVLDKIIGTAEAVPGIKGKVLAAIPKAARGLYRWSGNSLWKFDDEIKAQRYEELVKGGLSPARAGLRIGGELVDYSAKSGLANAIRPIAPFATWRTKAPLAVVRNAIENPGRTAALERAVPAAMGGAQGQDSATGKPWVSSLPGAETTELLTNPAKYGEATAGVIPRTALGTAAWLDTLARPSKNKYGRPMPKEDQHRRTQFTYGQEIPQFMLGSAPLYGQAMELAGHGMFDKIPPDVLARIMREVRIRPGTP